MRDLQTSGIGGCQPVRWDTGTVIDMVRSTTKKNVAVLPTVPASIRATKGSTGGYTYQGNKVVLASPLVITGGNEISICIPRHASHQFQLLMS